MERQGVCLIVSVVVTCLFLLVLPVGYAKPLNAASMRSFSEKLTKEDAVDYKIEVIMIPMQRDRRQDDTDGGRPDDDGSGSDADSSEDQDSTEVSSSEANQSSRDEETQTNESPEDSQDEQNQTADESRDSEDDESEDSQDAASDQNQGSESKASEDEESQSTDESQTEEQTQPDESRGRSEDSQDAASDQSQSEVSEDEESQNDESEASQGDESGDSQDNERSQNNENEASGDDEQNQDNESGDDEASNVNNEASGDEQSQDNESRDDEQSQASDGEASGDDEQSQASNSEASGGDEQSQASDGEASGGDEQSQSNESEASGDDRQTQDSDSQDNEQSGDNESEGDTTQDDNLSDNHTTPPGIIRTCAADELLDLSEGAAVGEVAVGHCESGLFEGTWMCQYDVELGAAKWVQIECDAPEDLEFATSAELLVADPVEAVGIVLEHVNNHTLSLQIAASILERLMLVPVPSSNLLISGHYTAEYTAKKLCQLSSVLLELEALPKEERASIGTKLLHALDVFALKYANSGEIIDCGSVVKVEVKDIVPGVDVVGIRVGQNSIVLPNSELRRSIGHSTVKAASFYFEDLSNILLDNATQSGSSVITPVVSTALLCGHTLCNTSYLELSRPVKITLERSLVPSTTKKNQERYDLCSFWQLLPDVYYPSTGTWSQRGCIMNEDESTERKTVCECDHLTHFAVLLSPGVEFGEKHEFALQTIGYIGITISLFAMAITVFINACFRSLWSMRTYIHINLCLSLMVAQLLFVVAIDKTGNKIACSFVAIALHYLFLVSFMWMLMEGVVLYVLLVKVFVEGFQKKYTIQFTVASYGLPALYMCVTVPLGFLLNGEWHYGSEEMCWLRYDTHFIWTFIAPVILIIIINIGFFIMAIVIMRKHQHKKKDSGKVSSIRKWIKTAASLTSVMGLTWISGVLVFYEALIPVAYIFTIFVAFEGVAIFVLFVVVSKQVREALLMCVRDRVNDSEFLSEHIGTRLEKLTPNSTKSRKESTIQYYKNLQKQRKESNQRELSEMSATNHLYINSEAHVCINESSVNGDSTVTAEVKGQE